MGHNVPNEAYFLIDFSEKKSTMKSHDCWFQFALEKSTIYYLGPSLISKLKYDNPKYWFQNSIQSVSFVFS